jgi:hypothetical protein
VADRSRSALLDTCPVEGRDMMWPDQLEDREVESLDLYFADDDIDEDKDIDDEDWDDDDDWEDEDEEEEDDDDEDDDDDEEDEDWDDDYDVRRPRRKVRFGQED